MCNSFFSEAGHESEIPHFLQKSLHLWCFIWAEGKAATFRIRPTEHVVCSHTVAGSSCFCRHSKTTGSLPPTLGKPCLAWLGRMLPQAAASKAGFSIPLSVFLALNSLSLCPLIKDYSTSTTSLPAATMPSIRKIKKSFLAAP